MANGFYSSSLSSLLILFLIFSSNVYSASGHYGLSQHGLGHGFGMNDCCLKNWLFFAADDSSRSFANFADTLCRVRCEEMLKQGYLQKQSKRDYATNAINDVSLSGDKGCKEHIDCGGQQVCFDGACKTSYPTKERCSKADQCCSACACRYGRCWKPTQPKTLLQDSVSVGGKKKKIVGMKQVESLTGMKGKDSLHIGSGQHREADRFENVVSSHNKKHNLSSNSNSKFTSKEAHEGEVTAHGSKATFGKLTSSSHIETGAYNSHGDGSISQTFYSVETSTKLSRLNEAQMLVRMLQSSLESLMLSNSTLTTDGLECHESSCICDGFTCLQKISRLLDEQHSTLSTQLSAEQSSNNPSGDGQLDKPSLLPHHFDQRSLVSRLSNASSILLMNLTSNA
ncbi:hypothetical protein M513_07686 [Trichuris suis]|uniref:DUF7107 domain-containing protein n=1 Tax=Trichuris suis TaxID=68888 RepID=A0A085M2M7_9BILA|nr:hypothetical protein M513_07686 [Trichuris suis]